MLCQKIDAETHELVVIRLIPGGSAEFGNTRGFRKGYPYFGNQNSLKIKAYKSHSFLLAKDYHRDSRVNKRGAYCNAPAVIRRQRMPRINHEPHEQEEGNREWGKNKLTRRTFGSRRQGTKENA